MTASACCMNSSHWYKTFLPRAITISSVGLLFTALTRNQQNIVDVVAVREYSVSADGGRGGGKSDVIAPMMTHDYYSSLSSGYKTDHWTAVGKTLLILYSAYLDPDQAAVTVFGVIHRKVLQMREKFLCHLFYSDEADFMGGNTTAAAGDYTGAYLTRVVVGARLLPLPDDHNTSFLALRIICHNRSLVLSKRILKIGITLSSVTDVPSILIHVHHPPHPLHPSNRHVPNSTPNSTPTFKPNFTSISTPYTTPISTPNSTPNSAHTATQPRIALCLPAITGGYNDSVHMIAFLELHLLLGVSKVVVYDESIGSGVRQVLSSYARRGYVQILPWAICPQIANLTSKNHSENCEKQIHYYGQMAAINDCLYRFRYNYDYIAFYDLDEVLVPHTGETWFDIIHRYQNWKHFGSLNFRNEFFSHRESSVTLAQLEQNVTGVGSELQYLTEVVRWEYIFAHRRRSKALVSPRHVTIQGIHYTFQFKLGHEEKRVDVDVAAIHHYRVRNILKSGRKVIDDKTMEKYRERLVKGIERGVKWVVEGSKVDGGGA